MTEQWMLSDAYDSRIAMAQQAETVLLLYHYGKNMRKTFLAMSHKMDGHGESMGQYSEPDCQAGYLSVSIISTLSSWNHQIMDGHDG
ncbi:hypothetical protein PT300_12160 [Enterobacteriaceae bacterium ESL0689]|nr:hypothetical protein [Enterobacteriaceae bacterium ESL0689]